MSSVLLAAASVRVRQKRAPSPLDKRIEAVVSSSGSDSFHSYRNGDLTGWSHAGYMPRIATVYGKDADRMPFDFTEVLAAVAPCPVFISAPVHDDNVSLAGVLDCVAVAQPVFRLFGACGAFARTRTGC